MWHRLGNDNPFVIFIKNVQISPQYWIDTIIFRCFTELRADAKIFGNEEPDVAECYAGGSWEKREQDPIYCNGCRAVGDNSPCEGLSDRYHGWLELVSLFSGKSSTKKSNGG